MRCSRRSFLAAALAAIPLTLFAFLPRSFALMLMMDPLEGKWKVKIEPDEDARKGGEKDFDDTLVFTGNKFSSEAYKKKGFDAVEYDEDVRSFGPATFTANQSSEKEGKIKWSGTVTASAIEGELTLTKKDGSERHFTYKGEKQM
jgi:hypothetical protein